MTFIGVRDGQHWFHMDQSPGAGVFTAGMEITVTGRITPVVYTPPPTPITASSSVVDVAKYLSGLGLSKDYGDIARAQNLDGDVFLSVSEADLESLGMNVFGDRRKTMKALTAMKGDDKKKVADDKNDNSKKK